MEVGIAILLFVCMTALLYVLLSLKITKQVDLQIKEFYKTRIHQDMQEFYREMESYAALFENRIQRFRTLVDKGDSLLGRLNNADAVEKSAGADEIKKVEKEAPPVTAKEIKHTQKKGVVKSQARGAVNVAQKVKKNNAKPVQKANGKAITATIKTPKANTLKLVPSVPVQEKLTVPPIAELPQQQFAEEYDITIAQELLKDIDSVESTHEQSIQKKSIEVKPKEVSVEKAMTQSDATAPESESSIMEIFAQIGRKAKPLFFSEKEKTKLAALTPNAQPARVANTNATPKTPQSGNQAAVSDFTEVLRRAEEIKAQKKAEREKAELDARATFYAQGDSFANATKFEKEQETNVRPVTTQENETQRNTLAVKKLDQHTINFLIDSLVKDNGYRKQALRALTENNVPLSEIAWLSKIDIGELELMRQLGRF
ncbi:MAG TPA: hypothetical protein PLY93_01135 [Turneriella sp.]|nr:hypothetical protein [Turneriella sp.]